MSNSDEPKIELRVTDHISEAYIIDIDGREAGYATLYDDHVVFESASPANEWDTTVKHKDLGEGLVNPTTSDVLAAATAWVKDHVDDFGEEE